MHNHIELHFSSQQKIQMKLKTTEASIHFKLRMVEPFFWAVSKFLDAPELIDAEISASCSIRFFILVKLEKLHHPIHQSQNAHKQKFITDRRLKTNTIVKVDIDIKKSHKQSSIQHSFDTKISIQEKKELKKKNLEINLFHV